MYLSVYTTRLVFMFSVKHEVPQLSCKSVIPVSHGAQAVELPEVSLCNFFAEIRAHHGLLDSNAGGASRLHLRSVISVRSVLTIYCGTDVMQVSHRRSSDINEVQKAVC